MTQPASSAIRLRRELARAMNLRFRIARDHEVISPVGVALALVRDSIERQIVDPSVEQLARLRREVGDRAIASGADPASIEVDIAIDPIRNRRGFTGEQSSERIRDDRSFSRGRVSNSYQQRLLN